jgi:hypothetical protein
MKPKPKSSVQRSATFNEGGTTKMHKQQAAGAARSGRTGKVQTAAPGAKRAVGGGHAPVPGRALPAKPGRTGPRKG